MANDFDLKPNFPVAAVADLYANRAKKEQDMRDTQQQQLLQGLNLFKQGVDSMVQRRHQMAQALALGKQLGIPEEAAQQMTPDQVLALHKETQPIQVPYQDKEGQIHVLNLSKGSKGLPSQGGGNTGLPQQTQFTDQEGSPLIFNRSNGTYTKARVAPGIIATPAKGSTEAVNQAATAAQLIPKVDELYDKIDTLGPLPRRFSTTGVGSVAYPEINALMSDIKRQGFVVGGKQLTGTELKVVTDAFFPSWKDTDESRLVKREALKGALTGSLSYLEAARVLGPAGQDARAILKKYQSKVKPSAINFSADEEKQYQAWKAAQKS